MIETAVPAGGGSPMVTAACTGDVATVAARARAELARRGVAIFAEFDHAAGARQSGLRMRDELVLVFGSPLVGTPLMQQVPELGVELPLRLLIWDSATGTRAGFVDPLHWGTWWPQLVEHPALAGMRALLTGLLDTVARE
jgi:hypothetical protein